MEKKFRFNVLENALPARRPHLTEFDSEEQKSEYEQVMRRLQETLDQLRKDIIEQPEKILPSFLKTLVHEPERLKDVAPLAVRKYAYVAKHLLKNIVDPGDTGGEFITFEQFCIEDTFDENRSIYFRLFNFDEQRPYESIYEELLESYVDNFQNSVAMVCHMIHLGVPMYVTDPDGNLSEDRASARYHFVNGLGKYFYSPNEHEVPDWVNGIHLKRSDVERHYLFFSQPEPPSAEEEAALVKAYRSSLGLSLEEGFPESDHLGFGTRLAHHASSMIKRFESEGYSRARSGEWPLQKEVVFWLTSNSGLSNREAEAIDLVTRPDHLRTR